MLKLKSLIVENERKLAGGFGVNIEKETVDNTNFRKVLYTTAQMQLVVMSVDVDIGEEVHRGTTQFLRVEAGQGVAVIDGKKYTLKDGDSVVVPSGSRHNIINIGDKPLKLYSLYAPPHHPEGTVHKTKEDAEE